MRADATIIGGGVIGLAVAMRLAREGLAVVLLERHPGFGRETSSRNSEVVHAGMYYPTGSLKARLCVAGNRSLYAWCEGHRVEARRIGKYIIATADDEVPALEAILARGRENGVPALRWAASGELAAAEPEVRAIAALFSPDTGIIDSHALMQSLADAALARGAALAWGHEYLGAERAGDGYRIRFREPGGAAGEVESARVVNAAGLSADQVAAGLGIDIDARKYRLTYVKGSYFRLGGAWRGRLTHLVYPVPHAGLAGLGCHVTLDLAGDVRLGPDVEFLPARTLDYSVPSARATRFAEAVRSYLPAVREADLLPGQSGIRARRITGDAAPPDFVIAEERAAGLPGWVNLVGIESPGLTCSLEIADEVARLVA
jgi:L-2-hydroxyglutarate oxidase LhgO